MQIPATKSPLESVYSSSPLFDGSAVCGQQALFGVRLMGRTGSAAKGEEEEEPLVQQCPSAAPLQLVISRAGTREQDAAALHGGAPTIMMILLHAKLAGGGAGETRRRASQSLEMWRRARAPQFAKTLAQMIKFPHSIAD